jgi:hypothetical protein
MPKLYAFMEGLVSVATSPAGDPMVLLIKTYPEDKDAMGAALPQHFPRITFRSGGKLTVQPLNGEDVSFLTGKPASPVAKTLDRLPSFAKILSFAKSSNGHGPKPAPPLAQLAQINVGCVGNTPGSTCLATGEHKPRLAGRVRIDQGSLTSIQVDDNGNPINAKPVRFKFLFMDNAAGPALDMPCDNALLLEIDSGANPIRLQIGNQTFPLDHALQAEKDAAKVVLAGPSTNCVIVHISDMVDPMLMKQMKMDNSADVHFPIFFDLLPNYTGARVIPTLMPQVKGQGDPPLSRCIPPQV